MGYTLSREEIVGLNNFTEGDSLAFEHFKEICSFMMVFPFGINSLGQRNNGRQMEG